ncbi:MAG: hypothetical protein ACU88J_09445 [Gammaproteobacteria bacterium]
MSANRLRGIDFNQRKFHAHRRLPMLPEVFDHTKALIGVVIEFLDHSLVPDWTDAHPDSNELRKANRHKKHA